MRGQNKRFAEKRCGGERNASGLEGPSYRDVPRELPARTGQAHTKAVNYLSCRIKSEADLAAFLISVRLCSPCEEPVTCSARRSALAVMTQRRLLSA